MRSKFNNYKKLEQSVDKGKSEVDHGALAEALSRKKYWKEKVQKSVKGKPKG